MYEGIFGLEVKTILVLTWSFWTWSISPPHGVLKFIFNRAARGKLGLASASFFFGGCGGDADENLALACGQIWSFQLFCWNRWMMQVLLQYSSGWVLRISWTRIQARNSWLACTCLKEEHVRCLSLSRTVLKEEEKGDELFSSFPCNVDREGGRNLSPLLLLLLECGDEDDCDGRWRSGNIGEVVIRHCGLRDAGARLPGMSFAPDCLLLLFLIFYFLVWGCLNRGWWDKEYWVLAWNWLSDEMGNWVGNGLGSGFGYSLGFCWAGRRRVTMWVRDWDWWRWGLFGCDWSLGAYLGLAADGLEMGRWEWARFGIGTEGFSCGMMNGSGGWWWWDGRIGVIMRINREDRSSLKPNCCGP